MRLRIASDQKSCPAVIAVVLATLGMVYTYDWGFGISETFEVLALAFAGAAVVGLRQAVAELERLVEQI